MTSIFMGPYGYGLLRLAADRWSAMIKCSYCGHESDEAAVRCGGCGTSLINPPPQSSLVTPHRMMGEIQQFIWNYFAVKRGHLYLGGLMLGLFAGFLGLMHYHGDGYPLWVLPFGGITGLGAVWLLSFTEKLQKRIELARASGDGIGAQLAFLIFVAFAAFISIVLVVAAAGAFLIGKI